MRSLSFLPIFFCITKSEASVQGVTVSEEQLGNFFNVLEDLKEDELFEGSIDEVFGGQFENLSESYKEVRFFLLSVINFQNKSNHFHNLEMTSEEVLAAFDAIIDKLTRDEMIANQAKTIVRDGISENREDFGFTSAAGNVPESLSRFSAFLLTMFFF